MEIMIMMIMYSCSHMTPAESRPVQAKCDFYAYSSHTGEGVSIGSVFYSLVGNEH